MGRPGGFNSQRDHRPLQSRGGHLSRFHQQIHFQQIQLATVPQQTCRTTNRLKTRLSVLLNKIKFQRFLARTVIYLSFPDYSCEQECNFGHIHSPSEEIYCGDYAAVILGVLSDALFRGKYAATFPQYRHQAEETDLQPGEGRQTRMGRPGSLNSEQYHLSLRSRNGHLNRFHQQIHFGESGDPALFMFPVKTPTLVISAYSH